MRETYQKQVETLLEALPYIRRFSGKTVVIKYGGAAMSSADLKEEFATDIVLLRYVGITPHHRARGRAEVSAYMERLDLPVHFVDGLRVTDAAAMEVAKMVLVGKVNKEIVRLINQKGAAAVGLCGDDGRLMEARRLVRSARGRRPSSTWVWSGEVTAGQHRAAATCSRPTTCRWWPRWAWATTARATTSTPTRWRRAGGRPAGGEGHLPDRRRRPLRGRRRRDEPTSPSARRPMCADLIDAGGVSRRHDPQAGGRARRPGRRRGGRPHHRRARAPLGPARDPDRRRRRGHEDRCLAGSSRR